MAELTPAQVEAVEQLASMNVDMWNDNAGHFSCAEANAIGDFLREFIGHRTEGAFLRAHAEDDDEGDQHYDLLIETEQG